MNPRLRILIVSLGAALAPLVQALECSTEEVGYIATFKVEPDRIAEFEGLVLDLTEKVRRLEPGVVFYAPYRGDEPGTYYFMERHQNEAARDAHALADDIRAVFGQIVPLLREPLDVKRVGALCP